MAKTVKKSLILAVLQVAVGTPGAPTVGDNAMLVRNISSKPLEAEWVALDYVRPFLGNSGQLGTTKHAELDFEIALAGSGAAGTAPAWDPLIQACAFAPTVVADTSVAYNPISEEPKRLTLYYYLDGLLHKITDAVGSVSIDLTAKSVPLLKFHFVGAYSPVTDTAFPAGSDFTAFQTPLAVNKANTPGWSMHGYSGCLQALTLDIANAVAWFARVNCEGAEISDRAPTGSVTMELNSVAAHDWYSTILGGVTDALSITHGVTPGNIVQIDCPKVQLTAPTYSDDSNVALIGATLNVNPNLGDDELIITVR
jgi:hypothetical protein